MRTPNKTELAFLSILRYPELQKTALKMCRDRERLFSEQSEPHLVKMWDAYMKTLVKYKDKYGLNPGSDIVASELVEAVNADPRLPDELKDFCDGLMQRLRADDIPRLDEARVLMKLLINKAGAAQVLNILHTGYSLSALIELKQKEDGLIAMTEPAVEEQKDEFVLNPLRDIQKLAKKSVRIPTGLNWLDDISSGGGREGDLWLILGPPAGGKSICAVQYSCAQAMLGKHTLWATYEQSIEGDLAERMIANITDTSLDHIRDVGFDNLSQDIKDRYWAAVAGVDDRLVAMDMTKVTGDPSDPTDYGGVRSIWKQFTKLKEEGRAPKTVILDWFGAMMSRISSNLGMDLSQGYRFKAQEEINHLIQFARTERILIIVFHQLDVKAAGARPTFLADATHAQDMHNMQNFFDLVAILGVKDVNNICYFSNPKARKGNRVVRTLHMIGEKSRFVMEDGWLPYRDGNFYKPSAAAAGDMDMKAAADSYSREIE